MNILFAKELAATHPLIVNGKRVQFELLDGNRGVLSLNSDTDQALIDALQKIAGTRGVYRLSEQEYLDLKKNYPPMRSGRQSSGVEIRPMPTRRLNPLQRAGVVAAAANAGDYSPQVAPSIVTESPAPAEQPKLPTTVPSNFKPATKRVRRNPAAEILAPAPS